MTYLQIINAVLRRIRQRTVTVLTGDDYVLMIGDIVNDAKRQCEEAWAWNALRTAFSIATVSGTAEYSLTDAETRATILNVTNDTDAFFLRKISPERYQSEQLSPAGNGSPYSYVVTGTDTNNDTKIALYPTPDAVYAVTVNTILRQADLSATTDVLSIPHTPVVHLATAMAARERGEVGGQTAIELFAMAKQSLGDAIALDSALNPTDLIFETI